MRFVITDHAVQRFIERVRPGFGPLAARAELGRLLRTYGEMSGEPPWFAEREVERQPDAWVRVDDDLFFPCRRMSTRTLVVDTVLTRGSISQLTRDERNARRRKRAAARRRARGRESSSGRAEL